ncbi:MAG: protein kinase domain-containing protein [Thermoguttaceae bacterium]
MHDPNPSLPIDKLTDEQQERLAVVLEEYLSAREQRSAPDVEAITAAHPDLKDAFVASLRSLAFLDRAAGQLVADEPDPLAPRIAQLPSEKRLGDFVLVREIGRGGMGIVYEARQISLDRRVALKALPFAAVLDQKQITRFENEARAAAQLHHPNIVPVYSVGCERGVHYYAMQYIEGASLDRALAEVRGEATAGPDDGHPGPTGEDSQSLADDHAKQSTLRALTTAESSRGRDYYRAVCRLGIQAAEALQHAHDCGIVHRDVKPSNLLLDRSGKLWVTDFGLARFLSSDAGLTLTGQVLGSLRYMSPEQAEGRSGLLDQRSDVYSLGITLYEAAALRPAFDGQVRADLLRRIVQDEPRPPRRIRPSIPADLENIILKAVSKAPEQRYQTALELADDLRRFLDGKPTLARRPTWLDRAGKWTRRHMGLVATAACVAILAAAGLAASTLAIAGAHAKTKAALEASEASRVRAEKHFQQAREIVDRLGARVAEQLAQVSGAEPVRAELLQDTLQYYRNFTRYAADDPGLQMDLATTHFKTGKIHEQIGNPDQALAEYQRALDTFQRLEQGTDASRRYAAQRALCHNDMGLLLSAAGRVAQARTALDTALQLLEELLKAAPDSAQALSDKALTLGNLGMLEHRAGNTDAAEQRFLAAAAIQQRLADDHPHRPAYRSALAVTFNNLSLVYTATDIARAEEACRKALAIQQQLTAAEPASIEYLGDLSLSWNNLGTLQSYRGAVAEAIQAYHQAVDIRRRLLRKAPSVVRFRSDLAVSCNNLGRLHSESGSQQEALEPLGEAIELFQQLVADYPDELNHRSCLGGALNNLAMADQRLGKPNEAEKAFRQAIDHQRYALEQAPGVAAFRQFLSNHYRNLGELLRQQGRTPEAIDMALARRKLWPGDPERLFAVAVELAGDAAGASDGQSPSQGRPLPSEWIEAVLETLQEAVEAGFCDTDRMRHQPGLTPVQEDPRFLAILQQIQEKPGTSPAEAGQGRRPSEQQQVKS